jgi:DNA-binding Lrp family transcriptional regulator
LDPLDVRIVKEIQSPASFRWNARESFASIAKKLGVDEETVRKRLAHMRQAGVLQSWRLIPNPHLIGQEIGVIDLESSDSRSKVTAIPQIKLVEGVVRIFDYQGARLGVLLYYGSEEAAERRVQLISSICGCDRANYWNLGFPACELTLKKIDWQIVKAIGKEPRKKLSEIAREVKVSTRTIRRRLDLMTKGNAFFMLAVVDFKKITAVPCNFRIFCPDRGKKRALDNLILSKQGQIYFAHTSAAEHSSFSLVCANVAEAEEVYSWMRTLDGVKDVRMAIIREILPVHEWLDGEIERKLREFSRN